MQHNFLFEHSTRTAVIIGWSFPDFVFGLLVILIFYGIDVLTVAGRRVIRLLAATVIIETIFSRPGMGKFVAFAARQLDDAGILKRRLLNHPGSGNG